MPEKIVSFTREKAERGFKIVSDAVNSTIGPKGKNVFLGDPTLPRFTNDGASIANKIVLHDKEEDAGAWVVRSMTAKVADEVGDQTTTCSVIGRAIFDEAHQRNEQSVEIEASLLAALPHVQKEIEKASHKTTLKEVKHIAIVSAENESLATLVAEIFEKKGVDAHVLVEDSDTIESSVEMKEGYEAKVGFLSPWLVTNVQRQTAEYQDVPVLCSHKKIDSITQLLPLYKALSEKGLSKLVIVCDDMDVAALGNVVANKRAGTFSTLVIRATGELLDDISSVVGATPISEQTGATFPLETDSDPFKALGVAASVVSTFGSPTSPGITTFIGKKGKTKAKEQAVLLEAQAELVKNEFERGSIKKRVAKLRSGIAVLRVGALSEQERGYLRDKADDAVKAVKSSLAEGYIEGGGMTLYRIAEALQGETIGEQILKKALQAPFRRIVENAGKDYADIVKNLPKNKGYDARTGEYKDMISSGIIDPAKGARIAVESAISSIGKFITCDSFIVDYVEEKKN